MRDIAPAQIKCFHRYKLIDSNQSDTLLLVTAIFRN